MKMVRHGQNTILDDIPFALESQAFNVSAQARYSAGL